MNKTFVASLENHNVYLINNNNVSFYLNVLKEKDATNITLDIKYKKKNSINDIVNYYEKIDNYNITLVVPLLEVSEENINFNKQSNYLSLVINCAYKLLTSNNVLVKDNINIIKHNSFKSAFTDFFISIFKNRVRYITLDNLVSEEVPYNKINAMNMSFVVGRPELDLTVKEEEMNEIIKETTEKEQELSNNKVQKVNFATSGYVSYYLLGFLTAIITLLALTFLIK